MLGLGGESSSASATSIISAGVIMNLFFALGCFTYRFMREREELSAVLGAVSAGSVAYEAGLRAASLQALSIVGLEQLANVRADRLQHSELRFMEIARALMLRPIFFLLDEPAAGLSADEIRRLGALITAISREGIGVLLVEHHADLIFDICDRVTVLNLGKVLAAGTPAEIRSHREVVSAYLGA